MEFTGRTALITGASSGLGAEFARRLAERGSDLVVVARRGELLERQARELSERHRVRVTPIATNLARAGVGTELRDELAARSITVSTLINNAGFATYNALVDEDPARIAAEIQLDVATLVDLTRAFLPQMIAGGAGALVNVASTAAYQPLPGMAVYGASKAFVLSFTEAVAYETKRTGIRVLALSPGATRTEFFDVVGTEAAAVGGFQTAEQVVTTALKALDKRRTPASVISGRANRISAAFAGLAPRSLAVATAGRMLSSGA
ncbi:MAG: SDR family oxidoreductase [Leifsonia sp.]